MGNEKRKAAGGVETGAAFEILRTHYINLGDCPKCQTCNAPICPLDADWHKRKHLAGDKCCMYLLESAKTGAKAVFECAGLGELHAAMVRATPAIITRHSNIRLAYERAKPTGSRMVSPQARKGANHDR